MKSTDSYFLKNGLEREEDESGQFCACYSGGGGYVMVPCCREDEYPRVNVEGREWEYQIKQFLGSL
jgi:hypothetical protein